MSTFDLVNVETLFEQALTESLEGLAFIEVETSQRLASLPGLKEDDWLTRINIETPFEAHVTLVFDDPFSNDLVENITAETEKITEDMIRDALSEVGNTVVGRLAFSLAGEDSDFSIGLPECSRGGNAGSFLSLGRKPCILEFSMLEGRILGIFETPEDAKVKVV